MGRAECERNSALGVGGVEDGYGEYDGYGEKWAGLAVNGEM